MNDFIHFDSNIVDGGVSIRVSSIDIFFYRKQDDMTVIYVRGGTPDCAFRVKGNQTERICEMIRNANY